MALQVGWASPVVAVVPAGTPDCHCLLAALAEQELQVAEAKEAVSLVVAVEEAVPLLAAEGAAAAQRYLVLIRPVVASLRLAE